ncbi:peptide/nickel transport system permease protein [Acetoanaerobium pronyense]|uniref:Peptide/nickel transport system permease protein n=1 Tax=Acetoanaerobium pronyense TaxID=1482736 RepID=A0ABS4KM25_9FIRM|nr:oligopeptide ABC transporter permease [Acetoanaerobium pronyense]MBP2028824.1 peptide/nickel transport system permease protein [Acetoanaerobium pronyense]
MAEATETIKIKKQNNDTIESPWRLAFRRLRKNKLAMTGLFALVFMFIFSFIGPLLSPYNVIQTNILNANKAPSAQHWLGTDSIGRDVLLRLMLGGRISLLVGLVSVSISVVVGTTVGGLSGFYGAWVDNLLMRMADIFMAAPFFPILIILSAVMSDRKVTPENRIFIVMFIIGILSWAGLSRLIRGQILSLREQEFMQAAEALGIRDSRKIMKHLIPNVIPTIIVSATLGIGSAILTESALSFLGLGVNPPIPSWGNMIQAANNFYNLQFRPWLWIPPGVCIFVTVMSINLLGDGLRDALDPKLKR